MCKQGVPQSPCVFLSFLYIFIYLFVCFNLELCCLAPEAQSLLPKTEVHKLVPRLLAFSEGSAKCFIKGSLSAATRTNS